MIDKICYQWNVFKSVFKSVVLYSNKMVQDYLLLSFNSVSVLVVNKNISLKK